MKLISILAIIGVIIIVVAIGYGINHSLTGFAVSDGADTGNEDAGSSVDTGNAENTNNTNEIIVNSTENETEDSHGGGGGGGGSSSDPVIPDEVCDFIDNDLDGEVDEGCANIYGTIYDADTDAPLEGINISFYDYATYSFDDYGNSSGDYETLVAKEIPDAVTDANGSYNVSLPEGIYNMVLQGSDEKDFEIHADKSKGALKHDVELDEDRLDDIFNAEGHILFSGKYEYNEENAYVCGDQIKFMMFGVNNDNDTNQTITFMIEDHNISPGVNGISVYNGSILDEDESLFIPAGGEKLDKVFEFEIPCSYNLGKHDIHVVWNDEKWHKIGNFFIIEDTTNPSINTEGTEDGLPGENIEVGYAAWDNAEPGTVRAMELGILEGADDTLTVIIDKDITEDSDNDTIEDNDADYEVDGGTLMYVNLTYNSSGSYTARFTVMDGTGNTDSEDVNITVYISEEEADNISKQAYSDILGISVASFTGDLFGISRTWDRYNAVALVGDEYLTENDIDEGDKNTINYFACSQYPYFIIIDPTTAETYNSTIRSFLNGILAC